MFRQVNKARWVWGTGMTEKVVWHVVRNLGFKQRIRLAGNDGLGSSRLANGTVQSFHVL